MTNEEVLKRKDDVFGCVPATKDHDGKIYFHTGLEKITVNYEQYKQLAKDLDLPLGD